jgi:hypothetical protein
MMTEDAGANGTILLTDEAIEMVRSKIDKSDINEIVEQCVKEAVGGE